MSFEPLFQTWIVVQWIFSSLNFGQVTDRRKATPMSPMCISTGVLKKHFTNKWKGKRSKNIYLPYVILNDTLSVWVQPCKNGWISLVGLRLVCCHVNCVAGDRGLRSTDRGQTENYERIPDWKQRADIAACVCVLCHVIYFWCVWFFHFTEMFPPFGVWYISMVSEGWLLRLV